MNPVLRQIHNHRSIRKYKSDPVPEGILHEILEAGLRASSSGNMQAFSIIVTSDSGIKKTLFKSHFKQSMVLDAPLLVTFCADFHRMRLWVEQNEAAPNFDNFMSFMIATLDATLAAQNTVLAAESLGLGACFMGTTLASCHEIGKILKCPEHVVPVVGFSLGYPDEKPEGRDRLPLRGLVHYQTYQDYSSQKIESVYKEREVKGWKRYQDIPELKKLVDENQVTNLAQVYTQVKYTRESHIEYSKNVLNYLKKQGFFRHKEEAPELMAV